MDKFSVAQTCIIQESFSVIYFILKKTGTLNQLALEFSENNKDLVELEKLLIKVDTILNHEKIMAYRHYNFREADTQLTTDFPEFFDENYSSSWKDLNFKSILRALLMTGDYQRIKDYFLMVPFAIEHDIVFFKDYARLILDSMEKEYPEDYKNLYWQYENEINRKHYLRHQTRIRHKDDVQYYKRMYGITFVHPHEDVISSLDSDFINNTLTWSETLDNDSGGSFWSRVSSQSKRETKSIRDICGLQQYRGAHFIDLIQEFLVPQISINSEVPSVFVEPVSIVLGQPEQSADLVSIL